MTLPPGSEWSNLDWLTALRADSDQARAAIRERLLRSLRAYLRRRGRGGPRSERLGWTKVQ